MVGWVTTEDNWSPANLAGTYQGVSPRKYKDQPVGRKLKMFTFSNARKIIWVSIKSFMSDGGVKKFCDMQGAMIIANNATNQCNFYQPHL